MSSNKKLVVLVGPTGVGKTAMAIRVAEKFKTEIISADSRQIFKQLNAGTAKPSEIELRKIQHHFISSHSIENNYDAGKYGVDALELIKGLFLKYDLIVVSGGSGLYVKAICEGFDEMPEVKAQLRDEIKKKYEKKGLLWLQNELKKSDSDYFEHEDTMNPQRMMRALEIVISTGKSINAFRQKKKLQHDFQIVKIGLNMDRKELYERLDTRMDEMINQGLFKEAEDLFNKRHLNALQTVGYNEVFGFLEKKYSKEEAIRLAKRNTRRYAKRQMTWFGKDKEVEWFKADDFNAITKHINSV